MRCQRSSLPGQPGLRVQSSQEEMKPIRTTETANAARYCLVVVSNSKSLGLYMFMNNT